MLISQMLYPFHHLLDHLILYLFYLRRMSARELVLSQAPSSFPVPQAVVCSPHSLDFWPEGMALGPRVWYLSSVCLQAVVCQLLSMLYAHFVG